MFNQIYYQPQGLRAGISQQLPDKRQQGFGTHFKDTPPPFIEEPKVDNKIERIKKPNKKNKKVKSKSTKKI